MNTNQITNVDGFTDFNPSAAWDTVVNSPLVLNGAAAASLVVSDDGWFLRADYGRNGDDLQLTGTGGRVVIIDDYFSQPQPPDLISQSGAVLKAATVIRLAGPLAPGQYAQAATGPDTGPIGRVETASGGVKATRADGTEVTLASGDPVFLGDILETSNDGTVGITFADESTFSLGEAGRMTLDELIFDPGAQEGAMHVNLIQGAFTFISGKIAKTDPNAMVVSTPTSTIGIRGTAGGGHVDSDGVTTAALMPEASGFIGEMSIGNAAGTQTINQALQAVTIASNTIAPTPPFIMSPQQLGQTFGSALNALPNGEQGLPDAVVNGAREGRTQQQQAEQAQQEAEVRQLEAEAEANQAEAVAAQTLAEAEAAATAEAQAAADAATAEAAAAEAAALAEAAIAAAEVPGATPEQIAVAEETAQLAEEAQALAEQEVARAQEARTATAQSQAQAAEAQAQLASANAEVAHAVVGVTQAQIAVVQTSAIGAVATAAVAAGIDTVPGVNQINNAEAALIQAQEQVQTAQQQVEQAAAAVERAYEQVQNIEAEIAAIEQQALAPTDGPGDGPEEADDRLEEPTDGPVEAEAEGPNEALGAGLRDGPLDGINPLAATEPNPTPGTDPITGPAPGIGLANNTGPVFEPFADAFSDPAFDPFSGAYDGTLVGSNIGPIGGPVFGQTLNAATTTPFISEDDVSPVGTTLFVIETFNETQMGTTGNDNLTGGPGNTQFTMIQGVSLDGDDILNGGQGTDEIYLQSLNQFQGIYDSSVLASPNLVYATSTGISGTIELNSVEQLFVNNGTESSVRLNIDITASGYGYVISGGAGNNVIDVSDGKTLSLIPNLDGVSHVLSDSDTLGTVLFGGAGNDTLTGSGEGDDIFGGAGSDTLHGGDGLDLLYGGGGDDVIDLGGGDDFADAGAGNDSVTGDIGDETVFGGSGNDYLNLGNGDNIGYGDDGDDTLIGGAGNDTLTGGGGNDQITLGNGVNVGSGGLGNDTIYGGSGIDTIGGGDGNDLIFMGLGDDSVTGGAGNDILKVGYNGSSSFASGQTAGSLDGGSGIDTIQLFANNDFSAVAISNIETLVFSASSAATFTSSQVTNLSSIDFGAVTASLTVGLTSGANFDAASLSLSNFTSGTDTLSYLGGAGNEALTLGSTNNTVSVTDVETITGGSGTDIITLGSGDQTIAASNIETLIGGAGNDTITITGSTGAVLTGGNGHDTLTGGSGSDVFRYTSASQSTSTLTDIITNFEATTVSEVLFLDGLLTGTFGFLGSEAVAFTGAAGGNNTEARFNNTSKLLEIDVDGNGTSDMDITLQGVSLGDLSSADFNVT